MAPRAGELVHVAGPVWLVIGEQQGRFPRSHSVLIRDGREALIDTGCGVEILRELRGRLAIDLVINTHTHPDHSAGNFLFDGVETLVPEAGYATSGDLQALSERFFDDEAIRPLWRSYVRRAMGFENQRPTACFPAGGELVVGDTVIRVIGAPGHTVDHCCLYLEEQRLLIAADIDLTPFGPWYGHPECDLEQFRRAVEQVRALKPEVVVSSHRPPLRRNVDRALQAFSAVFDKREARILAYLAEGECSPEEIVEAALIYGRYPYEPQLMRHWEWQMVVKHLDELIARGAVVRTATGGYRAV